MRRSVPLLKLCFALTFGLVAGEAAAPRATACSYFPVWTGFDGSPADGAENVPTDVVPIYVNALEGNAQAGSIAFTLQAADGSMVALTRRGVRSNQIAQWTELVPSVPLAVNTRYTLRAQTQPGPSTGVAHAAESMLQFTTGTGPSDGELAAPSPNVDHVGYETRHVEVGCGGGSPSTCIGMPADTFYAVTHLGSTYVARGASATTQIGARGSDLSDCLNLRERAPNGQLGVAQVLCREDAVLYLASDYFKSGLRCVASGLQWEGVPIAAVMSPISLDRWDELRSPSSTSPEAGVDAGLPGFGPEAGISADDSDSKQDTSPASVDLEPDAQEGCALASRTPHAMQVAPWLGLLAWLARSKRAVARASRTPRCRGKTRA